MIAPLYSQSPTRPRDSRPKIVAPKKSIPGLTSLNRKITAAADAAEDVRFAAICLLHDVDATFSAGRREGIDCGNAPS